MSDASAHLPRLSPAILLPSLRVLVRSPAVAAGLLASAPSAVTLARRGTDLSLAVIASGLLGSATLALAVEDPSATPSAAAPVSVPWRRAVRLVLVAAVVGAGWSSVAVAARLDGVPLGDLSSHAGPWAATAALAVGIALGLARAGEPSPGVAGAGAALMLVLTSSALAQFDQRFPTLAAPRSERWWWVCGLCAMAVLWLWRDPAARGLRLAASRCADAFRRAAGRPG